MGELYSEVKCNALRGQVANLQGQLEGATKIRDAWHKEAAGYAKSLEDKEEQTEYLSEEAAEARIRLIEDDLLPAAQDTLNQKIGAYETALEDRDSTKDDIAAKEDAIVALLNDIQGLETERENALARYVNENDSPDPNVLQGIYNGFQAAIDDLNLQINEILDNELMPLEDLLIEKNQALHKAIEEMNAAFEERDGLRDELNLLRSIDDLKEDLDKAGKGAERNNNVVQGLKNRIEDLQGEIRQKCPDEDEEAFDEEDDFEDDFEGDEDFEEEEDFEDDDFEEDDYEEDDEWN